MRLMIDPQATPTAHHSPIPVPLHWQDEVKAGLHRDVRLGVLEPVPVGEPVTWCHRMNSHMCQEEWHTKDNRFPTTEHPCQQGNTSRTVAITSGTIGPPRKEKTRLRRMEWLP